MKTNVPVKTATYQLIGLTCLVALFLLTTACGPQMTQQSAEAGEAVPLRYATLLKMQRTADYTLCEIADPWKAGRVLHRYVLVGADKPLPAALPEGTVVRTPLQHAVSFTSVHASLAYDLGAADRLIGVCDKDYILRPALCQLLASGRWQDMGAAHLPSVERLAAAQPDALLVSPFENVQYGPISHLGIPLIECADYMETSPLGRAEWMRFYGLLFGKEAEADSLFALTEAAYLSLKAQAAADSLRPTLLADQLTAGVWYVPGGRSTTGQLFADAGARYVFASDTASGSVARSFEAVYAAGRHADVWLTKYGAAHDETYASLRADYAPYAGLRPWRERRVWGCNVSCVAVFEETPFRPDRLLADLVSILHPTLLPNHRLRYYQPLQEE